MTGRRKPDGRHVVLSARFSEGTIDRLDKARGKVARATWIAQLVERQLAGELVRKAAS